MTLPNGDKLSRARPTSFKPVVHREAIVEVDAAILRQPAWRPDDPLGTLALNPAPRGTWHSERWQPVASFDRYPDRGVAADHDDAHPDDISRRYHDAYDHLRW